MAMLFYSQALLRMFFYIMMICRFSYDIIRARFSLFLICVCVVRASVQDRIQKVDFKKLVHEPRT